MCGHWILLKVAVDAVHAFEQVSSRVSVKQLQDDFCLATIDWNSHKITYFALYLFPWAAETLTSIEQTHKHINKQNLKAGLEGDEDGAENSIIYLWKQMGFQNEELSGWSFSSPRVKKEKAHQIKLVV